MKCKNITQFGKELRKMRIDCDISTKIMAADLNVSAAFISSIETGKRPVPDRLVDILAEKYEYVNQRINIFKEAAKLNKQEVRIKLDPFESARNKVALLFGEKFNNLTTKQIANIYLILTDENFN